MYMSYCRFYGTVSELSLCETALNDFINEDNAGAISSEEERKKAKELIRLCQYIAENYSEEDIDRQVEFYAEKEAEDDD